MMQKPLTVLLGLLFLVGGGSAVWFTMSDLGAPIAESRFAAVGGNLALSFIGYDEDGNPLYAEDEEVLIEEEEIVIYDDIDEEIVLYEGLGPPLFYEEVEEIYIYDDEPVYYDDGYWEYEVVEYEEISEPWYVRAFPGFGTVFQQIIPGQQTTRVVQPPVQQPVVRPQPSCWISAQPTLVASRGSSVLSWSSFNASRAALTGFGEVSLSGSRTVGGITSERTYTLSVAGQGGNGSCYTRITVQAPVSGPPSCIISANPDVIVRGQSTNLAWFSQNAASANVSGLGTVPTRGGISLSPIQTTTYTLTVADSSGQSNSCAVRVLVR